MFYKLIIISFICLPVSFHRYHYICFILPIIHIPIHTAITIRRSFHIIYFYFIFYFNFNQCRRFCFLSFSSFTTTGRFLYSFRYINLNLLYRIVPLIIIRFIITGSFISKRVIIASGNPKVVNTPSIFPAFTFRSILIG